MALLTLVACVGVPRPGARELRAARALDPSATLARLERGRARFVARCGGCHDLPRPDALSADRWPAELDRMAPRAHLAPEDRATLELYLRVTAPPGG